MLVVVNKLNNVVLGKFKGETMHKYFSWSKPEPHNIYEPNLKTHRKGYTPNNKISCDSSFIIDDSLINTKEIKTHLHDEKRSYIQYLGKKDGVK